MRAPNSKMNASNFLIANHKCTKTCKRNMFQVSQLNKNEYDNAIGMSFNEKGNCSPVGNIQFAGQPLLQKLLIIPKCQLLSHC